MMGITPGTRLGPYEILSAIGAGGMGEVYKAKDTRLDRTVAVKVLPSHVSGDPALRERFEREARTVAGLSHPHICTLHDVGHQDGIDFLVMEYLDGETLAQRLTRGPLPLDQALAIAIQIADALDKAHRAGIVHRDLKPGNIMLTKSGSKLLDFGLAKVTPAVIAASGLSMAPTGASPVTMQGTILGTLQYMAPEQIEGQDADARTDIFAFGAVLYEMLTGKKAFEGKSQASLIAAILEREPPPLTTLRPVMPPALDHIVARCLDKSPDERWHSAADLAKELAWIATGSATTEPPRPGHPRQIRVAWTVAACAGLLAVAAIAAAIFGTIGGGNPNTPRVARVAFPRPAGTSLTNTGRPIIAISPDGTNIVFAADYQLYVRNLDRDEAQPIRGTALGQVFQPFFSPDGEWVGFIDLYAATIKKIPVAGGVAVPIAPAGLPNGFGASWGPDGRIVFANSDGVFRVSADGGSPEKLVELKPGEAALRPQMLPDGDHVLFTLATGLATDRWDTASIVVQSLSTHDRLIVLKGGADARYVEGGHLVYALVDDILAVAFDPATRRVTGAPRVVEHGVLRSGAINTGASQFATSARGDLAYLPDAPVSNLLTVIDAGSGFPSGGYPFSGGQTPRVSPDGTRLAVTENNDIWIYPLSGGAAPRRVTSDGLSGFSVWISNSQIAFASRTDPWALRSQNVDGDNTTQTIVTLPRGTLAVPIGWSIDGATFFFAAGTDPAAGPTIQSLRPGDSPRKLWDGSPGSFSPNRDWIVFTGAERDRQVIYIGSVHDPSRKYQITKDGGHHPLWSRDGARVFYAANSSGPVTKLMAVDVKTSPTITFGQPSVVISELVQPLNQDRWYDVMPDGRVIAMVPDPRRSTRSGEIVVVLNWSEELKRLVPTK